MWLTLIISGALHGLVLLPVVLNIAGGSGFPQQEADEEWMSNAIRNDYDYPSVTFCYSLGSQLTLLPQTFPRRRRFHGERVDTYLIIQLGRTENYTIFENE
jgi:hypothetical protein